MKKGWFATWFLFLGIIIGFLLSPVKKGISVRIVDQSTAPSKFQDLKTPKKATSGK